MLLNHGSFCRKIVFSRNYLVFLSGSRFVFHFSLLTLSSIRWNWKNKHRLKFSHETVMTICSLVVLVVFKAQYKLLLLLWMTFIVLAVLYCLSNLLSSFLPVFAGTLFSFLWQLFLVIIVNAHCAVETWCTLSQQVNT